jgi:hypothetical protein
MMPRCIIFWKFEFEQIIFSSGLLSQYIAGTDMFSVMLPNDSAHLNSKDDSPWKKEARA